jgi:hypothetical protein
LRREQEERPSELLKGIRGLVAGALLLVAALEIARNEPLAVAWRGVEKAVPLEGWPLATIGVSLALMGLTFLSQSLVVNFKLVTQPRFMSTRPWKVYLGVQAALFLAGLALWFAAGVQVMPLQPR